MKIRAIYVTIVSILLLIAVGTAVWLKFFATTVPSSPYIQLQTNADFIQAQAAFDNGKWVQAIDLYKKAITHTDNTNQKLSVYYYLATAENITGQHVEAIQLLKQVIAAESLPNETRAYASQYLGIMTINLSNPAAHSAIMVEIFKASPYKEMYVQNDDALSTRHLFEYASSIYPLGVSEANIASWYIGNILTNKLSTTTEPGVSNIKLIQQKLVNADTDIERTKGTASESLIPQIYARKAEVTEGLWRVGIVSKEEALRAYTDALQSYSMYNTLPGDDWFLRFRYASFLAYAYGKSHQNDIHTIVTRLYLNTTYAALTKPFFTTLSTVRVTQAPTTALESSALRAWRIAELDSDFKNFLVSLGWSKNNF